HDPGHRNPKVKSSQLGERKFKPDDAWQQMINRAEHHRGEEAVELQLGLRRAEPGEFRHLADSRARHRDEHQRRKNEGHEAESDKTKRPAFRRTMGCSVGSMSRFFEPQARRYTTFKR